MKTQRIRLRVASAVILFCAAYILFASVAFAQTTGFSFQGRLNDGTTPANGRYDLQFQLFDAITGGTQIGATISRSDTTLINGVFSVTLDFGSTAFNNPNVFIEIGVRPNGSTNTYTILGPRQQLTVVPFAVRAASAANADNAANAVNANFAILATHATNAANAANAANATNATNADVAADANKLGGFPSSSFARLDYVNTGDLKTNGNLVIEGNTQQSLTGKGLVKAMVDVGYINNTGAGIDICYNGYTNNTTSDCGFTISNPLSGVTRINFGFNLFGHYFVITPRYSGGTLNLSNHNFGANYRVFGTNSVEIFTFAAGNSEDTTPCSFQLFVY